MIEQFPKIAGHAMAFGYDWLGRYFLMYRKLDVNGHFGCAMVSFGTNQAFGIPLSLIDFHDQELVMNADSMLAYQFWLDWRKIDSKPIAPNECIGYKVPLCLGGKDHEDNLERSDLNVYIGLTTQIWEAIRDLPEGTKVDNIRIE